MGKGMLLLLAGSSGSGKNTIINELRKSNKNVKFLVSHTTREMREYEQNGVTYNFVSKEEFERAIQNNEMLEYDITHKGYYGISKKTITETLEDDKVVVKDISVLGIINCRKQLAHKVKINSIFLTESKKVLKDRLIKRGEKNFKLRLKIYRKEQSQMGVCDYIIKNSHLETSVEMVEAIIKHGIKDLPLLPYCNVNKINKRKIKKYIKQIENGKKLKPIHVTVMNGKIHIIDSLEKYLASIFTEKNWPKRFVSLNLKPKTISNNEMQIWQKYINEAKSKTL